MNGTHHWKQLRQCLKYSHLKEATISVYHSTQKKSNFYKVITKDYEYDYLITNPPYSNKDEIIERCIESGKPCVLVLPIESLGGVKRHALYKKTNIAIYVPTKRIKFISEDGEDSKAPAHHSIVMLINAKRTEIIFEHQLEH